MELLNGREATKLFDAQAHIWKHMFSIMNTISLKCAIELNIPDIIHHHGRPMTLSELVEAIPINKAKTQGLYRLMRILTHSGFFLKQKLEVGSELTNEEEGYVLEPASVLLLKDEPFMMTMSALTPFMAQNLFYLGDWLKNDDSTLFQTAHGKSVWDFIEHDESFGKMFNEDMARDTRLMVGAMITDCKQVFDNLTSIVDVGGGTGVMMQAVANAFPYLQCISFDRPHVIAGLEGNKNLTYAGGDMFQAIPNANAVMLKWILHDWKDEDCVRILKQCKEAIPSQKNGGKVIVIDMVVGVQEDDEKSTETQLLFDIHMMSTVTGGEREEKQWAKLFADAGFARYDITHKLGLRSLIQLYP